MTQSMRGGNYLGGLAQEINRRRFMAALGLATGSLAGVSLPSFAAEGTATPTADQEQVGKVTALSQALCGGGTFVDSEVEALMKLLASDVKLSQGLDELLATPVDRLLSATPAAGSGSAEATAQAILLYWYTGQFNGNPVPDRAANYTQLLAWQAMYTPAWTTCKLYGGWAEAPTVAPQVPENS
jgi:hypothetical protein